MKSRKAEKRQSRNLIVILMSRTWILVNEVQSTYIIQLYIHNTYTYTTHTQYYIYVLARELGPENLSNIAVFLYSIFRPTCLRYELMSAIILRSCWGTHTTYRERNMRTCEDTNVLLSLIVKFIIAWMQLCLMAKLVQSSPSSASHNNNMSSLDAGFYVFGDSTVDPGNNDYITITPIKSNFLPYGRDLPNHSPTGRFTNAKLATDYIGMQLFINIFVCVCVAIYICTP